MDSGEWRVESGEGEAAMKEFVFFTSPNDEGQV